MPTTFSPHHFSGLKASTSVFTHIVNMQPKFYIGSAMHHTLDREYSRSRKDLQLTNERLVQAELALRYWREHDNLYIWAPIPIYAERADYRSLEMAIIQEWQPRLNYPFICQFFHPKKGILKKPALNTNAQFGLATLWRRAKHKFTPTLVRQILTHIRTAPKSPGTLDHHPCLRVQHESQIWTDQNAAVQWWGSHPLLCSPSSGNNIQEPFRTLSLHAVDSSIKWWKGKPAPQATALRAPWSLIPNLQQQLKQFLRKWHLQVLAYQVPCHTPSFKMVCIKHAAVLDQLCNHKQAIADWSTTQPATCCCTKWEPFEAAALNSSASLTRIRRVSGHCRRLLVKQGLPFQKGIPKPAQTWATRLDKAKRLTVHAKLRDLRFQPTSLDRAFQTRHVSHHQIIHQLISKNLRGRYLPLWRQTSLFFENLLPVLVLPSHRKNFSGSLHFRTGPPRSWIHRRISCQSSTSTTWKILPLGGRTRTAIASWLYPGKKEERVSQWPTHHLLCGLPVSSYAQHPRQNDLSTDPSGMSKSLCFWGCIHTPIYPSSNLHPSTQISLWWIRTLLVSSPALIKIVSSVHGSCS